MFTLKEGYEFGHLLRRENENVRAELMEKVLAYNIGQITRVRERRARGESGAIPGGIARRGVGNRKDGTIMHSYWSENPNSGCMTAP